MRCVLGIDIGTFETKASLLDERGVVVASASSPHLISMPSPGHVEHDADLVWWTGVVEVVRSILSHPGVDANQIAAVGCSGIGPCVLPLQRGLPLRPAILYGIDVRAEQQIEYMEQRLGSEAIRRRTGNDLTSQSAGPKIAWLRDHEPNVHGNADLFVTSQTYVVGRLTGEWVIDHGTAAYFHPFYDITRRVWDVSGFEDIVTIDRLPRLAWPTEVAGAVTVEAAALTGLAAGTPVIVGCADAPAEALSAGVISDGDTMLMYGSSHFVIQARSQPATGPSLYAAPYLFPDLFLLAGGTSTAGTLTRWFWDIVEFGTEPDFERLVQEAASSPVGSRGLLALPYFSGERTPVNDPNLTGSIIGLTLRHSRNDIYRAILEGIGFGVASLLGGFDATGRPVRNVLSVGGGTKHAEWTQIISDIANVSQQLRSGAGASIGDAMLAALSLGILEQPADIGRWLPEARAVEPDQARRESYAALRPLWRAFDEATRGISHQLRAIADKSELETL